MQSRGATGNRLATNRRKSRPSRKEGDEKPQGYRELEQSTGVRCYFAYLHRPWQRGSNENFNGLLRQYLPKGKSLSRVCQSECDRIVHKLNTRPRKRYAYKAPIERMQQLSGVLHLGC
ncbi:IS30 family transposase [Pseudoxanthomonas putridarboris]|uniref:IS30 family transposase n=1 Tax=Pseudoxanthomonas putridarboris TaxID=752605 RepID=A0ABU9J4B1_9GAMM